MSRAFVKEDDRDEALPLPEPELPPGVPNRITEAGAQRFEAELLQARRLRATLGDGAEDRAKRVELDARITWYERRISTFVPTGTPAQPQRVVFGARVRLEDEEGEERTWQIVGIDEADPSQGRVSWASPLAKAVLGAEAGDEVVLKTPRGEERLEILEIHGAPS